MAVFNVLRFGPKLSGFARRTRALRVAVSDWSTPFSGQSIIDAVYQSARVKSILLSSVRCEIALISLKKDSPRERGHCAVGEQNAN